MSDRKWYLSIEQAQIDASVLAERERCAGVAEHFRDACGECHWPEEAVIAAVNVANEVAAAIRKGDQP
jgi:hypothetical protein